MVVEAVAAGGVLTCVSALRLWGAWVPPTDRTHIRGDGNTSRGRRDWCRQHGTQPPVDGAVDDIPTALAHAARCLPDEDFVVICDSLLNRGRITPTDLEVLFANAPRRVRRLLARVDGRAESGTETMVRLRLRAPHLSIRPQVEIAGVGRVDLLIGTSLIIEVDGEAYHSSSTAYENDRLHDLHAQTLGYRVVRLTYRQVLYQWDVVGPLVHDLIARGDHRHAVTA